jgi:hypothetical protein
MSRAFTHDHARFETKLLPSAGGSSAYTAADPDADPPELALARQLGALRAGRSVRVRSGSDAVSLEATPEAVSLEFAGSGAPRPGPQLAFSVFADVFVRWFEATAPRLGGRIRQAIFPATHAL